jgi:hypothetical protein
MLREWVDYYWKRNEWDWVSRGTVWPLAMAVLVSSLVLLIGIPAVYGVLRLVSLGIGHAADQLAHVSTVRIVLDAVRKYLNEHAAGLPLSSSSLWWIWCVAGIILFLVSGIAASVGARIGWTMYGVASVGMVWAATADPGRYVAAGLAGLWWVFASLFAFRRRSSHVDESS